MESIARCYARKQDDGVNFKKFCADGDYRHIEKKGGDMNRTNVMENEKLRSSVRTDLEFAVHRIFRECQEELGITSGDIDPQSATDLKNAENALCDQICKVLEEQAKRSVPALVPGTPCVVVTHSFDPDVSVYEYDTDDEANDGVEKWYNTYLEEEIRNNSELNENECNLYKEDGWGQLTWADGAFTRFVQAHTMKEV